MLLSPTKDPLGAVTLVRNGKKFMEFDNSVVRNHGKTLVISNIRIL